MSLHEKPTVSQTADHNRGGWPGLTAISAASDTRLSLPPATVTTGVRPRRPQVRPFGRP